MSIEIGGKQYDIKLKPAVHEPGIGGFGIISGSFVVPPGASSASPYAPELQAPEGKVVISAGWSMASGQAMDDIRIVGSRPDGGGGRFWTLLVVNASATQPHQVDYYLSVADA